jgi:hypothetical protein
MTRPWMFVLSCVVALPSFAQQVERELTPQDFAYGVNAVTTGEAAGYRAPLPLAVYRQLVRTDYSDLRVFNADGKLVPYGLERPNSATTVAGNATALPLFPIRGDSVKALDSVRITIESGGTRLDAQRTGSGEAAQPAVGSYVIDARTIEAPIAAFELTWPQDAADFAGRLRVEVSDNLGNWTTVTDGAPIAQLRAGETRLVERRIEFPAVRSKFWRLSWSGPAAPFEVTAVSAEPARDDVEVARETLAASGVRVPGKPGELEFDLGARLPVDRVNLELPERNTIVEVALLSRASPKDAWHPVARSGFYRLAGTDGTAGDLANGALTIAVNSNRYWLVRVDPGAGGIGDGIPKLRVGWLPHDVVFLARGAPPFTLAYGSANAPAVASSLRSIPAGATILPAAFGEPRTLGGESRLHAAPQTRPFAFKTALLWGVLVLGVLILGAMAYRLSRELKA